MKNMILGVIVVIGLTSCSQQHKKNIDDEVIQLMEALKINELNDTIIELQYLQCVLSELKKVDSTFLSLKKTERAKFIELNYHKTNKCDSLLLNIKRGADFRLVE